MPIAVTNRVSFSSSGGHSANAGAAAALGGAVSLSPTIVVGGGGGPTLPADVSAGPAASEGCLWCSYNQISGFSAGQLQDVRDSWGVTSILANMGYMRGAGGASLFMSSITAITTFVSLVHAQGMKIYLGTRWLNYYNSATPGAAGNWFNDTKWTEYLQNNWAWHDLLSAIDQSGADGLTLDDEMFPIGGPPAGTPKWNYNYTGNGNSEATTRAKVFQRGGELGTLWESILPGLEVIEYHTSGHGGFPDDYDEDVSQANHSVKEPLVQIDLWDGIFSTSSCTLLTLQAASFYRAGTFGQIQYDTVSTMARLSRDWASWNDCHDRFRRSPFKWLGRSTNAGEDQPLTLAQIQTQLPVVRKIGMGGKWANYVQSFTLDNAYLTTAMEAEMRATSVPGTVGTEVPTCVITSVSRNGANVDVTGTAAHSWGIWHVAWKLYAANGTTLLSSGAYGHDFAPGVNDYNDVNGYDDATYPFDASITAANGTWLLTTARSIKGQEHSIKTEITV